MVALQAVTDRWDAVICAESAHINVDEGSAPERMGGLKLLTVPTPDGKLTTELIDKDWDFLPVVSCRTEACGVGEARH